MIVGYVPHESFPDLDRLSPSDLAAFLETSGTELASTPTGARCDKKGGYVFQDYGFAPDQCSRCCHLRSPATAEARRNICASRDSRRVQKSTGCTWQSSG